MVFSSMIFLCVFLPLVLCSYYICKNQYRNYVLLFFSFAFYAWGEPKAFLIMLAVILVNYCFAILIQEKKRFSKLFLTLDIIICLFCLYYFKYLDFSISVVNKFLHNNISLLHIALPIGISFYIFQSISYTVDVYRQQCKAQKNFAKLALYVSLFPQLIAGPIVKYHDIENEIDSRTISLDLFISGLRRFIIGLGKKVLIANAAASITDSVFLNDVNFAPSNILWLGAIAYAIQIYYDFSGYSDMAIGLGNMFGFHFAENFNYPYISTSITEFWRRWHISLSTWFKEYVYIPLGGNRVSKIRTLINIGIIFLLTGIWHGAAYTFIAWGLLHGFFNILEKIFGFNKTSKNIGLRIIQHFYTLFVVLIAWVIFRAPKLKFALIYILKMLCITKSNIIFIPEFNLQLFEVIMLIVGIVFSIPIFPKLSLLLNKIASNSKTNDIIISIIKNISCILLLLFCLLNLAGGTYNPFIYFRF